MQQDHQIFRIPLRPRLQSTGATVFMKPASEQSLIIRSSSAQEHKMTERLLLFPTIDSRPLRSRCACTEVRLCIAQLCLSVCGEKRNTTTKTKQCHCREVSACLVVQLQGLVQKPVHHACLRETRVHLHIRSKSVVAAQLFHQPNRLVQALRRVELCGNLPHHLHKGRSAMHGFALDKDVKHGVVRDRFDAGPRFLRVHVAVNQLLSLVRLDIRHWQAPEHYCSPLQAAGNQLLPQLTLSCLAVKLHGHGDVDNKQGRRCTICDRNSKCFRGIASKASPRVSCSARANSKASARPVSEPRSIISVR